MISFMVLTFNHKITPFNILEKINISNNKLNEFYEELYFLKEKLLLQTCNRRELYFLTENINDIFNIKNIFIKKFNLNKFEVDKFSKIYRDRFALFHLLKVICGLESMILGETQIVNQVKMSYQFAKENLFCEKYFNVIFQNIFKLNKEIRTKTQISKNAISLGGICYRIVKDFFKDELKNKVLLLIGTGQIIFSVYKWYIGKVNKIFIATNKNIEKAEILAENTNGTIINIQEIYDFLNYIDFIISATSAPHFIIRKEEIIKCNVNKKILIIDLALPRDIEPEIEQINNNIKIYNIDNIKDKIKENLLFKKRELDKIENIIYEKIGDLENEVKNRSEREQTIFIPGGRSNFFIEKEKIKI